MITLHVANEYEGAIQRRNAPHVSPSEDCVAKKDSVKAYWSPRPRHTGPLLRVRGVLTISNPAQPAAEAAPPARC